MRSVLEQFNQACSEMGPYQYVLDSRFGLYEAMNAVEIGDPKLDGGLHGGGVLLWPDFLARSPELSSPSPAQLRAILRELLRLHVIWWCSGAPLARTVFTCVYLFAPESEISSGAFAAFRGVRALAALLRAVVAEAEVAEEEDMCFGAPGLPLDEFVSWGAREFADLADEIDAECPDAAPWPALLRAFAPFLGELPTRLPALRPSALEISRYLALEDDREVASPDVLDPDPDLPHGCFDPRLSARTAPATVPRGFPELSARAARAEFRGVLRQLARLEILFLGRTPRAAAALRRPMTEFFDLQASLPRTDVVSRSCAAKAARALCQRLERGDPRVSALPEAGNPSEGKSGGGEEPPPRVMKSGGGESGEEPQLGEQLGRDPARRAPCVLTSLFLTECGVLSPAISDLLSHPDALESAFPALFFLLGASPRLCVALAHLGGARRARRLAQEARGWTRVARALPSDARRVGPHLAWALTRWRCESLRRICFQWAAEELLADIEYPMCYAMAQHLWEMRDGVVRGVREQCGGERETGIVDRPLERMRKCECAAANAMMQALVRYQGRSVWEEPGKLAPTCRERWRVRFRCLDHIDSPRPLSFEEWETEMRRSEREEDHVELLRRAVAMHRQVVVWGQEELERVAAAAANDPEPEEDWGELEESLRQDEGEEFERNRMVRWTMECAKGNMTWGNIVLQSIAATGVRVENGKKVVVYEHPHLKAAPELVLLKLKVKK